MKRALVTLSLASALLIVGCGVSFDATNTRAEFQKEHPDYTILHVSLPDPQAGSNIVVVSIAYKKPGDAREYWTTWDYEVKDGKHTLVGKGEERLFTVSENPSVPGENHVGVK